MLWLASFLNLHIFPIELMCLLRLLFLYTIIIATVILANCTRHLGNCTSNSILVIGNRAICRIHKRLPFYIFIPTTYLLAEIQAHISKSFFKYFLPFNEEQNIFQPAISILFITYQPIYIFMNNIYLNAMIQAYIPKIYFFDLAILKKDKKITSIFFSNMRLFFSFTIFFN